MSHHAEYRVSDVPGSEVVAGLETLEANALQPEAGPVVNTFRNDQDERIGFYMKTGGLAAVVKFRSTMRCSHGHWHNELDPALYLSATVPPEFHGFVAMGFPLSIYGQGPVGFEFTSDTTDVLVLPVYFSLSTRI